MMNFPDAPSTGQTYSNYKWDGEKWMPLPATFTDAPSDSKTYGRKNQTWSEIIAAVLEAPINGKSFARKDAAWAEIVADVTKSYVDTEMAKRVLKTGDTMSGALTAPLFNTTVGYAAQFGGSASTGIYLDGTNLAIRPPGANGVYFQSAAGGQTYGYWNSAGLYVNNQLIVSGTHTANGAVQWNQQPASVYQGGPGGLLIYANGSAGYDAFISYWRPGGGYACNMGLMNDNRFGFGGWSVGGVQYRFWSREDFGEPPVHNTRLVYVGDYSHGLNTGLAEPYGGTGCVTGGAGFNNGTYEHTQRYRQLQVRRSDGYYGSEEA